VKLAFSGGVLVAAWVAAWVPSAPLHAGDISYVVLNRSDVNSLVRVSEDGKSITTIAHGVGGYGLAVDENGDYIIAASTRLLRVRRSGSVETIALAPDGSHWLAVAIDPQGNLMLTDNVQHAVWRVSGKNGSVVKVVDYPVTHPINRESSGIVPDGAGGYLLIEENNATTELFRITSTGEIGAILLRGVKIPRGGAIVPDGSGGYLVGSPHNLLFRLSEAGEVKGFAQVPGRNPTGLARNPQTGEILVTLNQNFSLARVSADGAKVELFAVDRVRLPNPTAIVAEGAIGARR
jgi:sugar lactone lactonase YvrE